MSVYSVEDVARIIGGEILNYAAPKSQIKIIATDSRTLTYGKDTVFFALTGVRNDGHDYLPALIKKGVSAVVVSRIPEETMSFDETAVIKVGNTLEALQKLAAYHRKQFSFPVVGITGSNGKTIVKEWLYDLLSSKFSIIRSPKSYNSQVGVPLSVWFMNHDNNLAIIEAGISKPGEMENLEKIISPDIGIFTNIGSAHQENFSNEKQKVLEKLNLFKHSPG
jgi:UDP-N-acetylmuramyl pentapeptide synthase